MKRTLPVVLCLFLIGGLISCTPKSDYERLVDQELSRDVRMDTLFLGYYFGMPLDEFLEHSWNLNKEQKITGGAKIIYQMNELNHPATMLFYPEFRDRKIYKLPIEIQYDGWAPWNTHLAPDTLITNLVEQYEDQYNTSFITHTFPGDEKTSFVAIVGNKQIKIFRMDTRKAGIEFLDLTVQESSP